MEFYVEKERKLPVYGSYDVVVAGSGPAGFGAALAAARAGAKTLIIEQSSCLGGTSTAGLMSHWTGNVDSRMYREVLARSMAANGKAFSEEDEDKINIDSEKLKGIYLEMLTEAGADILFYTFVSDAINENGVAKGVIIENKSGRSCVYAKVIIDGTGDGDVAYKLGAEYFVGRETDGKMQPATLMFKVAGVDEARAVLIPSFETRYPTPKGELQALAKEHLPSPAGHVLLYKNPLPGVVTVNMTNCIDIDGRDTASLTKAEIVCRKQMYAIEAFLREYVPGYENCYIITAASLIGIRETRHFIGKKQMNEKDIVAATQFSDWVVRDAYFNFDIHNMSGASLDETGVQKEFTQTKGYTIPYGCLVPKDIKGLLLAGRCISGTHMAHSNYRAMPICLAMGEAAGYAAAIAVERGIMPDEVPVEDIQKKLV